MDVRHWLRGAASLDRTSSGAGSVRAIHRSVATDSHVSEASDEWSTSSTSFSPASTTATPTAAWARKRLAMPRAAASSCQTPGRIRPVWRHVHSARTSATPAHRRWVMWMTTWWSIDGATEPLHSGKLLPHDSWESVVATVAPTSRSPKVTPASHVTRRTYASRGGESASGNASRTTTRRTAARSAAAAP